MEYLIQPEVVETEEGSYSKQDEVVDLLKMHTEGIVTYWYNDGSFDFRVESGMFRRLEQILQDEDIVFHRH